MSNALLQSLRSSVPTNDNAMARGEGAALVHRYYRPFQRPAAEVEALRAALYAQPEVARKGAKHFIRKAIATASTELGWGMVESWFQSDSDGRALVRAFRARS